MSRIKKILESTKVNEADISAVIDNLKQKSSPSNILSALGTVSRTKASDYAYECKRLKDDGNGHSSEFEFISNQFKSWLLVSKTFSSLSFGDAQNCEFRYSGGSKKPVLVISELVNEYPLIDIVNYLINFGKTTVSSYRESYKKLDSNDDQLKNRFKTQAMNWEKLIGSLTRMKSIARKCEIK